MYVNTHAPMGTVTLSVYMDSLDLSDISDYKDYMMTTSDDEELPEYCVDFSYCWLN